MSSNESNPLDRLEKPADQRPIYEDYSTSKTQRKIWENPMVPLGMAGFFLAVGYGVRTVKNRPAHMPFSMFVMRFRVFAQSIAVGAMVAGVGYNIVKEKFLKPQSTGK